MDYNNFVTDSADKTCSMGDMRTNICTGIFYSHNNAINAAMIDNSLVVMLMVLFNFGMLNWLGKLHLMMNVNKVLIAFVLIKMEIYLLFDMIKVILEFLLELKKVMLCIKDMKMLFWIYVWS